MASPALSQVPTLPAMTDLQRARFETLQAQMQTLNAQAQAAMLTQSNCELLAGELQRKMDALMLEVRAGAAADVIAAAGETQGAA